MAIKTYNVKSYKQDIARFAERNLKLPISNNDLSIFFKKGQTARCGCF